MICVEWSDLINRCRERARNAIFMATIGLKKRHFLVYLVKYSERPKVPHANKATEGHSLICTCDLWKWCLALPGQFIRMLIWEVRFYFHTRTWTTTSQLITRMHSSPSLIRNLKQVRHSLCPNSQPNCAASLAPGLIISQ
jgi:hypothetical protein